MTSVVSPATESFLGLPGTTLAWGLLLAGGTLFLFSLFRRGLVLVRARRDPRWTSLGRRLGGLAADGLLQRRLPRYYPAAGALHIVIFWGFLVLALRSVELVGLGLRPGFAFPFLGGGLGVWYGGLKDGFELIVLLACGGAIYRRAVTRPARYEGSHTVEAYWVLGLIGFLMVSDLTFEGSGLVLGSAAHGGFLGSGLSAAAMSGLAPGSLKAIHLWSYWLHLLALFYFLNQLPYSKHFHILTALPNLFFRKHVRGAVPPPRWDEPDIKALYGLGMGTIEDLTWKQVLDLYSCTECGRCTANCPAQTAGRSLSPKQVTMKLRDHCYRPAAGSVVAGGVIAEEEIWSCTTCGSCEEHCPVFIEHVDKFIEMRRYLVGMEGRFPPELEPAFRNAETYFDPQGMGPARRSEWATGLRVEQLEPGRNVEVLFWVGCAGAFDGRSRDVAAAFAKILQKAGVAFGILGSNEKCCGDFARRTGNEYLFQFLARQNIEVLNQYPGAKIVTTCPHCFNTLKNEYPQLGGMFEVQHHAEYLLELVQAGKLQPAKESAKTIAFHDSCYLGRYNGIVEAPRELMKQLPGASIVEVPRNREQGFCCGAGGGYLWMEEKGRRLNELRIEEFGQVRPDLVATACPYCLMMLDDGLRAHPEAAPANCKVLDLVEVLGEAL